MGVLSLTIHNNLVVTVSDEDAHRVSQFKWTMFKKYPYSQELLCFLHHYIIGQRPVDIPEEYVVDHANRDKMDVSKLNLRWVSPSFNTWNRMIAASASSPYRGVTWVDTTQNWKVMFRGQSLGKVADPREGFVRYATAVVQEWPEWASTSDLLTGPGLLSAEEIQQALAGPMIVRSARQKLYGLPLGVHARRKGFYSTFRSKSSGMKSTVDEAQEWYKKARSMYEDDKRLQHWEQDIPMNDQGNALIKLSGKRGQGLTSTVPPLLWHALTFGHSWNVDPDGYVRGTWVGRSTSLHAMVYQLLNPMYVPKHGITIDHINHDTLDHSEVNLRPANQSLQGRNRKKQAGLSTNHMNICKVKRIHRPERPWQARFRYQGKRYDAGYWKTEEEALYALQKMKAKVIKD